MPEPAIANRRVELFAAHQSLPFEGRWAAEWRLGGVFSPGSPLSHGLRRDSSPPRGALRAAAPKKKAVIANQ